MTTKKKCGNCAYYLKGDESCDAPMPVFIVDEYLYVIDYTVSADRDASECKCYMRAGYTVVDLVHVVLDNPETEISVFANPDDADEYKNDMRGNHVAEEHLVIGRKE